MNVVKKFVRVRDRNQITLPAEILAGLPIHPGDFLELTRSGGTIEIRPTRLIALNGTSDAQSEFEQAVLDVKEKKYNTFSTASEYADHLKRRHRTKSREVAKASVKAAGD